MKKLTAILFTISLCALISMFATKPAQAYIERFTWLPPYIKKGYDSHYGDDVVIYKDGASASLIVPVRNTAYWDGLNVSKVIISFDWGQNETLDLSTDIKQVGWQETEIFTVTFTASASDAVSSEWAHEYTIYVEHVNATTGPTETLEPWSRDWDWWYPGYLFVVFPADQADACDCAEECNAYADAFPTWSFNNINASHLAGQASIKASLGEMHYTHGDYSLAETRYQEAIDLYGDALAAEAEWETKVDQAELEIALTEADANMAMANALLKEADAAVNQSYSWMLFGLGFVLIGVATIVYAFRKPMAS
jgi:hypothetical protein